MVKIPHSARLLDPMHQATMKETERKAPSLLIGAAHCRKFTIMIQRPLGGFNTEQLEGRISSLHELHTTLKKDPSRINTSNPPVKFFAANQHKAKLAARLLAFGHQALLFVGDTKIHRLRTNIVQHQNAPSTRRSIGTRTMKIQAVVEHLKTRW